MIEYVGERMQEGLRRMEHGRGACLDRDAWMEISLSRLLSPRGEFLGGMRIGDVDR